MKQLTDFTKEDWDRLFPIALEPHNPQWKSIFEAEKSQIEEALIAEEDLQVEHFGSTSIPGIASKPYIDMLIVIPSEWLFDPGIIKAMEKLDYQYFERTDATANYMIFVKGYHTDGTTDQVFHIHMCTADNDMADQLAFRDALIADPAKAQAYEELKLQLAKEYKHDRSGYRIAKGAFIAEVLKEYSMN